MKFEIYKTRYYLINKDVPYTGYNCSLIVDNCVLWSAINWDKKRLMYLHEYIEHKRIKNYELLTEEEYYYKYYLPYIESLKSDWEETTKDDFYDLYECLPPCRHTSFENGFFFYVSEAQTAYLHTFGLCYNDKYYLSIRDKYEKTESIMQSIQTLN